MITLFFILSYMRKQFTPKLLNDSLVALVALVTTLIVSDYTS